ncbi:MAG: hypothetical protein HKO94_07435 [Flavobacteriaceae bacterium]|nr:hypothetical protein [Flavobacteriaceae bacterium]
MSQGKTSRYIKYAIGEIILVVIGILIALQINNWNQNRKRLKQEQVLLVQIRDEMLSQYGDVHYDLEMLRMAERSHFKIVDHMNENLPYRDSLCFYYSLLKIDEYIYPNDGVYSKIQNVGLDIIRNDALRNGIQNLYETDFPRISKEKSFHPDISEFLNDYYSDNFQPNTNYNISFTLKFPADSIAGVKYNETTAHYPDEFDLDGRTRSFTMGYVPLDYEALKTDNKFTMLLDQVDIYRAYKILRYERAQRSIKQLVRAIDSTLSK